MPYESVSRVIFYSKYSWIRSLVKKEDNPFELISFDRKLEAEAWLCFRSREYSKYLHNRGQVKEFDKHRRLHLQHRYY